MGQNLTGQLISATYEDLVQISGSVLTNGLGNDINNLTVTASFATNASTAVSASHAINSDSAISASFATSATNAISASVAISASFAQTASFALNVIPIDTGSFVTTASISNADITFTKADASTFSITVNNVQNASTASIATSASFATNATSASFATNAGSALTATSASHAANADNAISASFATTASFALNANPPFPFTGSAQITGSLGVTGSIEIKSGSFEGSAIDNLTTPTASDAINHVVAISAADYSAIPVPDPNTFYVINDATGSLILGNTTVSGSLTVTGTLSAPGLTVSSASYAQTASLALFANNGFPYTGSAEITGSLIITGSAAVGGLENVITGESSFATGRNNQATGTVSAVIGGEYNTVSGFRSVAVAAEEATLSSTNGFIIGGYSNNAAGAYGGILGANGSTLAGTNSTIIGGASHNIDGNYNSIIAGQNHTITTAHSHSVIIGGNGLTPTDSNQVVVPNLLVSGSGGGITFADGTTQSTAAAGTSFNPMTTLYDYINDREANVTQTLNANAGGLFNLHISASGLHKIDTSTIATGVSASVNVYWYLDSFTTSGSVAALYNTYNSGSGGAILYRSIVSSSVGEYYAGNSALGGSSATVTKQARLSFQIAAGAAANPSMLSVFSDGTKILSTSQTPVSTNNIISSGNQGSPIT